MREQAFSTPRFSREKSRDEGLIPSRWEWVISRMALRTRSGTFSIFAVSLALAASGIAPSVTAAEKDRVTKDSKGMVHVESPPVSDKYKKPWPPGLEKEFWDRANLFIKAAAGKGYGNTFFENEKASYPNAMVDFLAGNRGKALSHLQSEDADAADNAHTNGIDLFPCFTLKGQVRKYFFFGDYLDPAYRQRMFEAAKIWTEQDPLRRPHPKYGTGKGGEGWTPAVKGSWVDVRNTDNLRAMREVAVYLFAEETGNRETQEIYRRRLQIYVGALYGIGMGEWDSSNYLGHTFTGYLNLYDFAKDPEMKALGKAACDWICAAAALKYWRGGYAGPNKRDYGGTNRLYGSGSASLFALYFGDCPVPDPRPERDQVNLITSGYRPPMAVMGLARKQFRKPVEILSTKPTYENQKPGNDQAPESFETLFFGNTFQIGSFVSAGANGDANPFGMMAFNTVRGVDFLLANTVPIVGHQGKQAGDQIGQYCELLVWLCPAKETKTFEFLVPKSGSIAKEDGVWFVPFEKTWLAIWPINLADYTIAQPAPPKNDPDAFGNAQLLKAQTNSDAAYAGFAMEIGEAPMTLDQFKAAVKAKTKLELGEIGQGKVKLTGIGGRVLEFTHNSTNDLPSVIRDGKTRDWAGEFDLYKPVHAPGPISLGWKKGVLRIEAGGKIFEETLSAEGKATFSEKDAH